MKKVKEFFKRIVHMKYKKYIVVLVVGVALVGFVGDDSFFAHLRYKKKISELRVEVEQKEKESERSLEEISKLHNDHRTQDRIAREMHFLKAEDEDVYTLSDDRMLTLKEMEDERVE